MAKYSAQLKATSPQGRTVTTSINNVNPEASATTVLAFTQRLNELTTNTYDSTDYIVTTNLDTEDPPVQKTEPTLTIAANYAEKFNLTWFNADAPAAIRGVVLTYNGDGQLYAYTTQRGAVAGIANKMPNGSETGDILVMRKGWESSSDAEPFTNSFTVVVGATEGENYAAKTIEFVVE